MSYPVHRQAFLSSPIGMYRKSHCTAPGISVGGGGCLSKMSKFDVKVFM